MARSSTSRLPGTPLIEDVALQQRGRTPWRRCRRPGRPDPRSPLIESNHWDDRERKEPPRPLETTAVPVGFQRVAGPAPPHARNRGRDGLVGNDELGKAFSKAGLQLGRGSRRSTSGQHAESRHRAPVSADRRSGDRRPPLVGEGGLEPPHPFGYRHLKPARLPISPLALGPGYISPPNEPVPMR